MKIDVSKIVVGSKLKTWTNQEVTVKGINTDPDLKPLIVLNKNKTQYYHFNQITEIL